MGCTVHETDYYEIMEKEVVSLLENMEEDLKIIIIHLLIHGISLLLEDTHSHTLREWNSWHAKAMEEHMKDTSRYCYGRV